MIKYQRLQVFVWNSRNSLHWKSNKTKSKIKTKGSQHMLFALVSGMRKLMFAYKKERVMSKGKCSFSFEYKHLCRDALLLRSEFSQTDIFSLLLFCIIFIFIFLLSDSLQIRKIKNNNTVLYTTLCYTIKCKQSFQQFLVINELTFCLTKWI